MKSARLWVKGTFAAILLGILLFSVDWHDVAGQVLGLAWPALFAGLLVFALQFPVCVWKWSSALKLHDLQFPGRYLLSVHCSAFFFNNFLPSAIGGDAYKIYRTLPTTGAKSSAVSAVLLDRVIGFAALLTLGALAAAMLLPTRAISHTVLGILLASSVGLLLALYAVFRGWLKPLTQRLRRVSMFDAFERNLKLVLRPHPSWPPLLAGSFCFQALATFWLYFLFASMGAGLGVAECALIAAAAGIASVVPITISGIGVVEGSIAAAATALGVPYEVAVLGALLNRLGVVLMSALCGIVYLLDRDREPARLKASAAPGSGRETESRTG